MLSLGKSFYHHFNLRFLLSESNFQGFEAKVQILFGDEFNN